MPPERAVDVFVDVKSRMVHKLKYLEIDSKVGERS
jgi:hypothetical protein